MSTDFEKQTIERLDCLTNDVNNLKSDVSTLKSDMNNMQISMLSIQRSLLLIEDQVMNKIPALFDGYSMHQEKQEKQQQEIAVLDEKVENHDIRISYLEQKV